MVHEYPRVQVTTLMWASCANCALGTV